MSQERLTELLMDGAGETVAREYVAKVEEGLTRVSWERLALFCKHLHCLPSHITKLAELLATGGSEAEIAELLEAMSR